MLAPGAHAPEFTLPDARGESVSLSSLLKHGALILYFYPADFTPGCTREACQIRDLYPQIQSAGMQVAGVSPQTPESHLVFAEKYHLPFVLLSDADRCVVRMYGVQGPFGLGVRRTTFLINANGKILDAVASNLHIGAHVRFVRQATTRGSPTH